MTAGAVRISWGSNIPGREAKSLDVFASAVARFEDLAKSGRIHSHQEYFALTGRAGGFMVASGDVEELQKILAEPETIALNSKAESIVQDFQVELYVGGTDQAVQELMGTYTGAMQEIGYL
jgi:hypothetical protein